MLLRPPQHKKQKEADKEEFESYIGKIALLSNKLFEGLDDNEFLYCFINSQNDEEFYSYNWTK